MPLTAIDAIAVIAMMILDTQLMDVVVAMFDVVSAKINVRFIFSDHKRTMTAHDQKFFSDWQSDQDNKSYTYPRGCDTPNISPSTSIIASIVAPTKTMLFYIPSGPILALVLVIGFGTGAASNDVLFVGMKQLMDSFILPLYTSLVILYLSIRVYYHISDASASKSPPSTSTQDEEALRLAKSAKQPIDLSGAFKLMENDNFEAFLAAQGVPWALRGAANKVRPTHRITHEGNIITIKIEGVMESQTTYTIGGKPKQGKIRGRRFADQVTYIDSGICTTKRACDDGYTVKVNRKISPDKQEIRMESSVTFDENSKPSIQCRQLFRRVE